MAFAPAPYATRLFSCNGETPRQVAQNITFLTTVLAGLKDLLNESRVQPKHSSMFRHISTILAPHTTAITGHIESGQLSLAVFTSSSHTALTHIIPGENGGQLLKNFDRSSTTVDFDQHLQDIVDIIQFLFHNDTPDRYVAHFIMFLHRRAHPVLAARMGALTSFWQKPPTRTAANYYASCTSHDIPQVPRHIMLHGRQAIYDELSQYGLEYESPPGDESYARYCITSSNIATWAAFLDRTYTKMEDLVLGRQVLNTTDSELLLNAMEIFVVLMNTKSLFHIIFTNAKLISELLHGRASRAHLSEIELMGQYQDTLPTWLRENEDTFQLEWNSRWQPVANHIVQCYETITIWYFAALDIIRSSQKHTPSTKLIVQHFATASPPCDLNDQDESETRFMANYMNYIKTYGSAHSVSAGSFMLARVVGAAKLAKEARVHAESIPIAMAGAAPQDTLPSAIGTTGLCCRTCAIFAQVLGEDDLVAGSHNVIMPWCSPPGVSLETLKKMRQALIVDFHWQACTFLPLED